MRLTEGTRATGTSPFTSEVPPSGCRIRCPLYYMAQGALLVFLGACLGCTGDTVDVSPEISQKSAPGVFHAGVTRAMITPQELGWLGGYRSPHQLGTR
jgi:hypothetical protein